MDSEQPANEHLGTAWEIAIVIVMVVLVAAILAATVFQIRRRRRQKQRQAPEADVENAKPPRRATRAQEKRRRTGSLNAFNEIAEKHNHPVRGDRHTEEDIQKPSPTLQLKQANESSYNEYLSKNPPNYYWEERFH